MTDYVNKKTDYPLPRLNGVPGIALPEDFSLEAADRGLSGTNNDLTQPTTIMAELSETQKTLIRSPASKNYGEAIARLGGAYSGPGFNVIFRPHFHKTPEDMPKALAEDFKGPDLLQLNLTHELWTFPSVKTDLGKIPNRVANPSAEDGTFQREDVFLRGIPYTQIVRDVTATTGEFAGGRIPVDALGKSKNASLQNNIQDIHFEPGLFVNIPESKPVTDKPTISRMASIPHGTTINAQGPAATVSNVLGKAPDIPPLNRTATKPFFIKDGTFPKFYDNEFNIASINATRLPQDLRLFIKKNSINESITQEMMQDPNTLLREHNKDKNFTQVVKFTVSTLPMHQPADLKTTNGLKEQSCPHLAARKALKDVADGLPANSTNPAIVAAKKSLNDALSSMARTVPTEDAVAAAALSTLPAVGTSNIAQLDGALGGPDANPNAKTAKVESTFWISTVSYTIDNPSRWEPGKGKAPLQLSPIMNDKWAKDTVPSFIFPTDQPVEKGRYAVEATQVQYSQTVDLLFNTIVWPHISVATVVPIRPVLVNFAKAIK